MVYRSKCPFDRTKPESSDYGCQSTGTVVLEYRTLQEWGWKILFDRPVTVQLA